MLIKKYTKLNVKHSRKGTFEGVSTKDFDTNDKWYPIAVAGKKVEGINTEWIAGDLIPCKSSFCHISIVE